MGGLNYGNETPQSRARAHAFSKGSLLTMVSWQLGILVADWAKDYISGPDLSRTCIVWGLVAFLLFVGLFDILGRQPPEMSAIFWGGVGVAGAFIAGALMIGSSGESWGYVAVASLFVAVCGTTAFFWPGYLFPYPKS